MTNMFILSIAIPSDTLQYLQSVNDNIDAIRRIVDVSNSKIANEISAVNTMLVAFTIVFGILGVILGLYISWLQKKVSKMSDNIAMKEQKIETLANIVEETDKKIHCDICDLYAELRDEETMTLLRRLEEEPQDISNLSKLLLARSLEDDGFPIMKNAYLKLISLGDEANEGGGLTEPSYKKQFLLLFFQHYMYLSVQDDDLRKDLVTEFELGMTCAFKRDIIKTTDDFCKALSVNGVSFDKKALLVDYLKALNESKYCNLVELKNIFQENTSKDLLVEAIDQCTSDKCYLEMFGVEAPVDSDEGKNDDKEKEVTK